MFLGSRSLEKTFEQANRIAEGLALDPGEFGDFRDEPGLAHLSAFKERLAPSGTEKNEELAAIRRVILTLDPAAAREGIKSLLHALGPDLLDIGKGPLRHRTLVLKPRQHALLGSSRGTLATQGFGPTAYLPEHGPKPFCRIIDFVHLISNTDDQSNCQP